ncbi:MAG TPA: GGDEF domain-containing protein [Deltaproteobacteria bacterium]|nr:GGDEF domain-containing protein [Deltaproteobacteria bacterium]
MISGHIFPYVLSPLATLLTCFSLIFIITKSPEVSKEFRILAFTCISVSLWSLAYISPHFMASSGPVSGISLLEPFSLLILPFTLHLTHTVLANRRRTVFVWAAYALAVSMMGASWFGIADDSQVKVFGAVLAFSALAYNLSCFTDMKKLPSGGGSLVPGYLLASGTSLFLLLFAVNPFVKDFPAPLSFSFIPLILISSGLASLSKGDAEEPSVRLDLFNAFIIIFIMFPMFCDLLFISFHIRDLYIDETASWLFHRTIVTIVSFSVAVTCASLAFRKAESRIEALLYTVVCLLVCILSLRDFIISFLPDGLSRQIVPINNIFLVNIVGICSHLVLIVARRTDVSKIAACYLPGILLMPVLFSEWFPEKGILAGDPIAFKGMGPVFVIALFLAMLSYTGVVLKREMKSERNVYRRNGIIFTLAGIVSAMVLLSGSLITSIGFDSYPLYNLSFIPLILMGYGIFYRDIQRINIYTRRQILSSGLRLILIFIYCLLMLCVVRIFIQYTPDFIAARVIPYGIPPLLSFLSAAFLSLFVLGLEKNRLESQLFSIVCFCYSLLNLDIFLVGIVPDIKLALFISRADHFFLSLLLMGVSLHLVYLVIGKKDHRWLVYAAYLVGPVMAPLSQTDYYFQGMYTYYWGYFARKAVLYDVMSSLWGLGIAYSIYLLIQTLRRDDILNRNMVKYVLTAFMILAVLSMSNNPAIYGYEIYPLGTFVFVALFFFAYGLFKFNLKMALQYVRIILFWAGLIAISLMAGLAPGFFLGGGDSFLSVFTGILMVAVLYQYIKKGWDAVLDLFIRKSADALSEGFYRLTDDLSRAHHREKIHQVLCSWFFEVLEGSCLISLFSLPDLSGQRVYYGWKAWNSQQEAGLFGDMKSSGRESSSLHIGKDHPLIQICRYEQTIHTKESILRMNPSIEAFDGSEGPLRDTEIVIPILSKGVLLAIILLGRKADGSPYTSSELDVLHNISLVLGPQIENAVLLEELEEKVEVRTKELNRTLAESMQKEREIRGNNEIITRQNQIFRTLLETSTRIHHIENLDDLFAFILSQLHTLFAGFRGGIILENMRRNILEATSFIGISEEEQRVILGMRERIFDPDFGRALNDALVREGVPVSEGDVWTIFPMESRESKIMGGMIFKGQAIDRLTQEIFTVFLGQLSAVTQNKLLMIQLERMASTDGLTGLYNRAFLNQELAKSILYAKKFRNIFFSIMMIDVNGLKKLNDTYGHEKGDEAIIQVAQLLKAECRNTDIASRLGGDEFAVLMPSTSLSQAEILCRRIVEASEKLHVVVTNNGDQPVSIPLSISVGLASSDCTSPDDVMKSADAMMYSAKERYYASRGWARS